VPLSQTDGPWWKRARRRAIRRSHDGCLVPCAGSWVGAEQSGWWCRCRRSVALGGTVLMRSFWLRPDQERALALSSALTGNSRVWSRSYYRQ
jgi:hypothetical protein